MDANNAGKIRVRRKIEMDNAIAGFTPIPKVKMSNTKVKINGVGLSTLHFGKDGVNADEILSKLNTPSSLTIPCKSAVSKTSKNTAKKSSRRYAVNTSEVFDATYADELFETDAEFVAGAPAPKGIDLGRNPMMVEYNVNVEAYIHSDDGADAGTANVLIEAKPLPILIAPKITCEWKRVFAITLNKTSGGTQEVKFVDITPSDKKLTSDYLKSKLIAKTKAESNILTSEVLVASMKKLYCASD